MKLPNPVMIDPTILGAELKPSASVYVLVLLDGEAGQPTLNLVFSSSQVISPETSFVFAISDDIEEEDLPKDRENSNADDLTRHFAEQIKLTILDVDPSMPILRILVTTNGNTYSDDVEFADWMREYITFSA